MLKRVLLEVVMSNDDDANNRGKWAYKNPGVSRRSACEIEGTSGFTNKHQTAFKISQADIIRIQQKEKKTSVSTKDEEKLQFSHIHLSEMTLQ
jgi:hypothetical protein